MLESQEKADPKGLPFLVIPLGEETYVVLRKHTNRCDYCITTHSQDTHKGTAVSLNSFEAWSIFI